jgi:hypothetical protein
MDIKQINSAIINGTWTNDQLSSMIDAVKFAKSQLTQQNRRLFKIGDNVKFTSNRNGMNYTGTIKKIAIKYITVNTGNLLYKVPANMLEAA